MAQEVDIKEFNPCSSNIVTDVTTTSTAEIQLRDSSVPTGTLQLRIVNEGNFTIHIRRGKTGMAAATNAFFPVPAGSERIMAFRGDDTHVRMLCPSGTSRVHTQLGRGV